VLNGQLDPIRGLMSRQLKLKGNMMQIMKTPKAAIELVAAARTVPTEWPS
jgi:putative sterol carrier protein